MTQTPDITPEAVERIATDLMGFDAAYKMPTCSTAAHTLAALSARLAEVEAERDEAVEGCGNFWTALARAEAAEARIEELEAALDKAEQKYQRDCLGLNNEGDPIGGNPPSGWKPRAEAVAAIITSVLGEPT